MSELRFLILKFDFFIRMLDFECFEGVDYIFLVFVVLMFSKDLVFFGGLVDDS